MTDARRTIRWVLNILALVGGILALPNFVGLLPESVITWIAGLTPALNLILSWMRKNSLGATAVRLWTIIGRGY